MFSRFGTKSSKNSNFSTNNNDSSEFLKAIKNNDTEKAKSYIPLLSIWKIKDENNLTPLHISSYNNNYELTEIIISEVKKGLGLTTNKISNFMNEKTNDGFTALHYAVKNNNIKMVKLLKQYGAKIESVTNSGKNVVHIASEFNHPTMLIYLILNEAVDISCIDENGSTPLHWACYSGAYEVVNYLLKLKADINAKDKENITPLFLAAANNKENIVRLLLMHGVDTNIRNNKNELPIDIAKKKHYNNIVEILSEKDYNLLCTLEFPDRYIQPSNIYKNLILFIIIITELIIFILVLPFLEEIFHLLANLSTFILCLLTYILLIIVPPKYIKNTSLLNECGGENNNQPLRTLLERGVELENYCPVCYIENKKNITHCFICNKCVLNMSHHCFWFNRCICRRNKIFYLFFLFFSFIYAIESIFICSNLLFDTVTIPYIKSFFPTWFYFDIDRGFRVLGSSIILVFSFIVSFPLFFLFMIEIFKKCGLLGKKMDKNIEIIDEINFGKKLNINSNSDYNLIEEKETIIELNKKSEDDNVKEIINIEEKNDNVENKDNKKDNVDDKDNKNDKNDNENNNINNQIINNNSVKIPKDDFPLVDARSSEVK